MFIVLGALLIMAANAYSFTVHLKPWGVVVENLKKEDRRVTLIKNSKEKLTYPTYSRKRVIFIVPWKNGDRFLVETDRGERLTVYGRKPLLILKIYAPMGQLSRSITLPSVSEEENIKVIGPSGTYTIGLVLEGTGREVEVKVGNRTLLLKNEFERRFMIFKAHLKEGLPFEKTIDIVKPIKSRLKLIFSLARLPLKELIDVTSWKLPTDFAGFSEPYRLKDTIALRNPLWEALGRRLGLTMPRDPGEPVAFQAVTVKNKTPHPITILITSDFLDPYTKEPVKGFYPKDWRATGGTKKVVGFLKLPGHSEKTAVLPIYANPYLKEGRYVKKLSISLLGVKERPIELEGWIYVRKPRPISDIWAAFSILLGVAFFGLFIKYHGKILEKLGTRSLVLIGTVGSVGFCVRFSGFLIFNILYAVLGPFNVLVGGLVSEIAYYVTLTVLVVLIPRVGTVSLSGIVSYIMGAVVMGSLSVLGLIFLGCSLLTREIFLYLFGVTRGKPGKLRTALSLSMADSFEKATSLIIHTVFFRLFYPMWYIVLVTAVTGFIYTGIGVWLGFPLGEKLRRIGK